MPVIILKVPKEQAVRLLAAEATRFLAELRCQLD
jgi:hypothetical protein